MHQPRLDAEGERDVRVRRWETAFHTPMVAWISWRVPVRPLDPAHDQRMPLRLISRHLGVVLGYRDSFVEECLPVFGGPHRSARR